MDRRIPVRGPYLSAVDVEERFRFCDEIEVTIVLTPLRWRDGDLNSPEPVGERTTSAIRISRLYATESRAVASIVRQMLRGLFAEFLDLKDIL